MLTRLLSVALLLALLVSMAPPVGAIQKKPSAFSPELLADLARLRDAAVKDDFALKQVAALSNNIGPRLSGSAQAEQAVKYVADTLRKEGCEVRLQKVMVPHWVRGVETAELVAFPGQAPGTTQKVMVTALGGSVATPADGITAEVVVASSFADLNALGRSKVEGKIVLFTAKFDDGLAKQGQADTAYGLVTPFRRNGASAAAKLGALAAINTSAGGGGNRLPHTGAMNYAGDAPKIPAAATTDEDTDLISSLVKQGTVRMHLKLTPQTLPDVESYNVIADLKGSEHPEEIVIVSGHLDSWDLGTGAIDDAAGLATAMGTIHLIRQLGIKPKRTIRLVAWMNEENGLAGGRGYAKDFEAELAKHVAAIEADSGGGRPLGIRAQATDAAIDTLEPLSGVLKPIGAGVLYPTREANGADLRPMSLKGVPTFAPLQDVRNYFTYHHTAADTFDKVAPKDLAECTAAVAVLALALANLPEPIPQNPPAQPERP